MPENIIAPPEIALTSSVESELKSEIANETHTRKIGEIRWLHILLLGGLSAFGPISIDMYLPALPALSRELGASMAEIQITLSACIFGLALGQLITGPLSDKWGRKRPLLIGMAVYIVASLLCLTAPSVGVLTGLRFLQGLAGAAGTVTALAIARDLYTGSALARALSLVGVISGLAPILAPVLGSQLLNFTAWHGIFIALAVFGLVLLLLSALGYSESLPQAKRKSGGLVGVLKTFGQLLTDRRFVGYALSCGFGFAAAIVYISVSPFILQNNYSLSPQLFGLLFGFNALGLVAMSQLSARLAGRIAPHKLLGWGISANVTGGLLLLLVVLTNVGLAGILPALFIIVASLGLIAPNATTLALANTPAAGSAAALLGILQLTIGALVAPLIGLGSTTSAVPMAGAIAAFGLATGLTFLLLCRPVSIIGSGTEN